MAISPALMALVKEGKNRYSRGGGKTIKFKEGKTKIRLIATEDKFWQDLGVHWIKREQGGKPVAVVGCSDHVYGRPCPIDAAIEKALATIHDDDTLKLVKDWKTKKSVLLKAIIRDGSDASPDPQILEAPPTVFGDILSVIESYAEEDVDALDPKTGLDFIVERRGKGMNTEYTVMVAPKSEALTKDQVNKAKELDLLAHIEREFFKGEETKALTAIEEVTGVTVALPGSRSSGLLTSVAKAAPKETVIEETVIEEAAVEEEAVEEEPVRKPAGKPAAAKAAPVEDVTDAVDDDELEKMLKELEAD